MLSVVPKSQVVIDVSIEIMRIFIKLSEFTLDYNALGKQFIEIFSILDALVNETKKTDKKVMGFIK